MGSLEIMSDEMCDIAARGAVTRRYGKTSARPTLLFSAFALGCAAVAGALILDLRSFDRFNPVVAPRSAVGPSVSSEVALLPVKAVAKRPTLEPGAGATDTADGLSSFFSPKALSYPPSSFGEGVLDHASFEPNSTRPLTPPISAGRAPSPLSPFMVEANHFPIPRALSSPTGVAVADASQVSGRGEHVSMPPGAGVPQPPPMPMSRPPELNWPVGRASFDPSRRHVAKYLRAAPSLAPPDNRNFLEKFFGLQQPLSGSVMAYASPEDGVVNNSRSFASSPASPFEGGTAIYDISAHSVLLPNGSVLEAHSGLGPMLDDPRSVTSKDRGAIPPQTYNLTLRESLFHGVQALRLTPVGRGSVFGRDGFLAHTYMLGPRGDSNGCISFRNYAAFLQAYQQGEIKRLIVVAQR
jgi:hypothetical protein